MRSTEELAVGGASCHMDGYIGLSLVLESGRADDTAWIPVLAVRVAWKRRYVRQETSLAVLPVSSFSTCTY